MREDSIYLYNDEDDSTESTEKLVTSSSEGKFEIVLDVIKVNTNLVIEE